MVVIFGIFLISSCVKDSYTPVSSQLKADLSVLPSTGNGLVYANFNQLINSPVNEYFRESIQEKMADNPEYKKFFEVTGFDIMKDMDRGYFILEEVEGNSNALFLGMAKGNFAPEKIKTYAESQDKEKKIHTYEYNGKTVYLVDEEIGFVFADNSTLYLGNQANLEKAVDLFKNPDNSTSFWLEKVKNVKYKDGFFMTAKTGDIIREYADQYDGGELKGGLSAIKSLENVHFSLDLKNTIKFEGVGYFSDVEKAELFYDASKGAWSAAKLAISDDRDAVDIANKVNFNLSELKVKVDGDMTIEEAKKLLEQVNFIPMKFKRAKTKSKI